MAKWMSKLLGDEFDLRAISKLFNTPECLVAKDADGAYYLSSESYASEADVSRADSASREQLARINSLMKVRDLSFEFVSVESIYKVNDDGTRQRYVLVSGIASGRARVFADATVTGPDGLPVPSPEPAISQARLKLAQHDTYVSETLTFWSECRIGDAGFWVSANKVYERICADMGGGHRTKDDIKKGRREIVRRGWTTDAEFRNFTEPANNYTITGKAARHGVDEIVRQGITPMNQGEAIVFIQRLLNHWLTWKI